MYDSKNDRPIKGSSEISDLTSKREIKKTKGHVFLLFGRKESSSLEHKVPMQEADRTAGSAHYCEGRSGRASERSEARKGRHQSGRQARTSCYILEEHSNSDTRKEVPAVNEDPRGTASRA